MAETFISLLPFRDKCWLVALFLLLPLGHRESVKRFVSLQFLNLRHSVGLLGRVISPLQGGYLTQTQNKHRHPYLEWDWNPRSGSAVAQEVSRWLTTAAARVRIGAACGICRGQSGIGAGFLRVLRFPLRIIPPISPSSSSPGAGTIGLLVAAVPSGSNWTPPPHYNN
jgi:hypothetical protein